MRGYRTGMVAALVVAVLVVAGCGSRATDKENRGAMRVGIVDVGRVLNELPEYKQMSDEYEKERLQLFNGLKPGTDLKQFAETHKDELNKSAQKWAEMKRKLLDKVCEKVRVASEVVSKEKKIDIVLQSAPWYPVKQTLAVDITTEVIFTLRDTKQSVH